MKNLGEYIQDNLYLEKLYIDRNFITNEGIKILSDYLLGNTTINEINIENLNHITDSSSWSLITIAKNSYISIISMQGTSITPNVKQEIINAFNIPLEEREISIKSNTKSASKLS